MDDASPRVQAGPGTGGTGGHGTHTIPGRHTGAEGQHAAARTGTRTIPGRHTAAWTGDAAKLDAGIPRSLRAEPHPGQPTPPRTRPRLTGAGWLVLLGYLVAGVLATWPRTAFVVTGRLPANHDQASYVWGLWWVAHQVVHLGNPWFTRYLGAPAGVNLGFDTLMPLVGLIMTPVTLAFGASTAYGVLAIVTPGLLCFVTYRTARLWLTSQLAAIATGALYGLSTMLTWRDWYHLNIAIGALFLPLALEATVRLLRSPSLRRAVILGCVLGASVLVNQESAIFAAAMTVVILARWLVQSGGPSRAGTARAHPVGHGPVQQSGQDPGGQCTRRTKLWLTGLAAAVSAVVASPQLLAMAGQAAAGGATVSPARLAYADTVFGVPVTSLFAPSPRLSRLGLHLPWQYYYAHSGEGILTFGVALTALAVLGLIVARRRRGTVLLGVGWLVSAALALGPSLAVGRHVYLPLPVSWHGVTMSGIMPYTWLVHLPGMAGFRESDRFALAGLLPAVLLAGSGIEWLRRHSRAALTVALMLAVLEAGYAGRPKLGTMPAAMPALDGPIAADHSHSVVVDIPYGIRGGLVPDGDSISPRALVLATEDGHPRAISYTSWTSTQTIRALRGNSFFSGLIAAQDGSLTGVDVQAARQAAVRSGVRWAVLWTKTPVITAYLHEVGFRYGYRADKVSVYRLVIHRS